MVRLELGEPKCIQEMLNGVAITLTEEILDKTTLLSVQNTSKEKLLMVLAELTEYSSWIWVMEIADAVTLVRATL